MPPFPTLVADDLGEFPSYRLRLSSYLPGFNRKVPLNTIRSVQDRSLKLIIPTRKMSTWPALLSRVTQMLHILLELRSLVALVALRSILPISLKLILMLVLNLIWKMLRPMMVLRTPLLKISAYVVDSDDWCRNSGIWFGFCCTRVYWKPLT